MRTKFKLKLNSAGVVALLNDPGVAADLDRRGRAIASAAPTGAGEEWDVNSYAGRDRAQTVVRTANTAARRSAAEDLSLLRALDAGR